jgi:DNA/RNA-binding domain of Phe-tRNA-synthetase-like protein
VVFADGTDRAHARRWTNRQSGLSAVRPETSTVLIVAEALHPSAAEDVPRLVDALGERLGKAWNPPMATAILTAASPRFDF